MSHCKLYHVSEDRKIESFSPRVSPSHFKTIQTDVIFAISEKMLHNYLLPRDCPRVTFYATDKSTQKDKEKFIGFGAADYVMAVESKWLIKIQRTTLYLYEMPAESFILLDECAGYYISKEEIKPVSVKPVYNVLEELTNRNIELRFMPSIQQLANLVKSSTLNFSLIRMSNYIV